MNNQDAFDATQRVDLDGQPHPPTQHKQPRSNAPQRPTPAQRAAKKKKQQRNLLIGLCAGALVLLIVLGVVLVSVLNQPTEDDGLILKGVNAAGVDLGGMTPEQAKQALRDATGNTYTQLDMTVSVLDTTVTLSPTDTGARLDVDAVVNAAYDYGRTGSRAEQERAKKQAATAGYTVSVLNHLNLNTDYIKSVVDDLGARYSTMLSESTYSLSGQRPELQQPVYDLEQVYQTLTIQIGTAEYALNTQALYQQILDAYQINIFQVTGECQVNPPAAINYEALYAYCGCVAPVNAEFNADTYQVTDEVYGYGFTIDQLKAAVEAAEYGETVTVELRFIEPDVLKEFYDMFTDTIASFTTTLTGDANWNANVILSAELLNGSVIKPGAEFSFNTIIGEPTVRRGFHRAGMYLGKSYQQIVGGGICQTASALYYCALLADMEILERHGHSFAPSFTQSGFDAEVYYGSLDLRIRNNSDSPIRIDASVIGSELTIAFIGTDTRDYRVELSYKIEETFDHDTVFHTLAEDNTAGYKDGDVIREGVAGSLIRTFITRYNKETGEKLTQVIDGKRVSDILIAESYYAKQDRIVAQLYHPPVIEPDPGPSSDPTGPSTDPSDPSTDPSDPSTDPSDPSTDPTDPSDPATPFEPSVE